MVDILLSTYNGEAYLEKFLASLKKQIYKNFKLIVRDDGSSDSTANILCNFIAENSMAVEICGDSGTHLGVVRSYESLLRISSAQYVMFADQDDIWHENKVGNMLHHIRQAELEYKGSALLVYSDLTVCDEFGKQLSTSFVKYQRISPFRNTATDLCVQNNVTGCTMVINMDLKKKIVYPFPQAVICYDWYLALLAAVSGKIIFIPQAYADYRKHSNNVFGPQKYSLMSHFSLLLTGKKSLYARLVRSQKQAEAFLAQYEKIIPEDLKKSLGCWAQLDYNRKMKKIFTCLQYGFCKNTLLRTLGMWWAL